jgi:hypothetical protein
MKFNDDDDGSDEQELIDEMRNIGVSDVKSKSSTKKGKKASSGSKSGTYFFMNDLIVLS